MKKIIIYISAAVLLLAFGSELRAQGGIELAKRYLKLANSYRQVGEYSLAEQFAEKAKNMLGGSRTFDGKYWTAVANEYLAYIYCDQGNTELAKSAVLSALETYSKIIKQKDGSPLASSIFLQQIEQFGCPCVSAGMQDDLPAYEPDENMALGSDDEYNEGEEPEAVQEETETETKVTGMKGDEKIERRVEKRIIKKRIMPSATTSYAGNALSRDYTNTKLSSVPSDLPRNLQNMSLAQNKITSVPDLSRFRNLSYLDLADNKIKEVPSSINRMSNLRFLSLRNNQLSSLPESMSSMKNLQVLDLRGNPKLSFPQIKKMIQAMPNTLIYHDEFILKPDEEEEEY